MRSELDLDLDLDLDLELLDLDLRVLDLLLLLLRDLVFVLVLATFASIAATTPLRAVVLTDRFNAAGFFCSANIGI